MFSNQVRTELKDYNMSFTDLAKIVGDRWKSITPDEKEQYDRTALKAKEEYLEALAKYEQTDDHKVYMAHKDMNGIWSYHLSVGCSCF